MNEIEHYHPALGSSGIVELKKDRLISDTDKIIRDSQIASHLESVKYLLVESYRNRKFSEKEIPIDLVWADFSRNGFSQRYSKIAMTWYNNGRDFEHLERMVLDGEEPPREYDLHD